MNKTKIVVSTVIVIIIAAIATSLAIVKNQNNKIPTIVLNGQERVKLNLNDTYEEKGAKAFIQENDISANIVIDGKVDTSKPGKYQVKYTVFSAKSKNVVTIERIVEVEDRVAPTITLKGKKEVTINVGEKYQDEGCIAQDNYDGDITHKVNITGKVDTKKEGNYTITYQVQDSSGNKVKETRTVKVKKKEVVKNKETSQTVTTATTSNSKLDKSKKGLPVLMYHFFYDSKKGEKGADNNWMEVSAFEEQMKYLSNNNYYFPSWSEVEAYIDGKKTLPEKSVVITIDDGDETFIKYAIPIIEKYHIKATSFVVTSWNGDWLPKQYKSAKMDFQSHSHDMHRPGANGKGRFVNVSYKEALEDVTKSKNIIGNCTIFCYPFGHYNDPAVKVLKEAGYKLAFTTKEGRVYPGANKYQLPRVRMSKKMSISAFKEIVK